MNEDCYSGWQLLLKMLQNRFRLGLGHHRGKRCDIGLLNRLQASKVFQQTPSGALADPRNVHQLGRPVTNLAALAVEGYSKSVGLIADELD
jgi:hypothetical protein